MTVVAPAVGSISPRCSVDAFDFKGWALRVEAAIDNPPPRGPLFEREGRVAAQKHAVASTEALMALAEEAVVAAGKTPWEQNRVLSPEDVRLREALVSKLEAIKNNAGFHPSFKKKLALVRYSYFLVEHDPLEKKLFRDRAVKLGSDGAKDDQWAHPPASTRPTVAELWLEPSRLLKDGVPVSLTVGGQAVATAVLAVQAGLQVDSVKDVLWGVLMARLGWEVADGAGYVIHAVLDQVDPEHAPKALKNDAENFQFHHHDPTNILRRDSLEMMDRIAIVGAPLTALIAWLDPSLGTAMFSGGLLTGALLSMESHKQAHTPDDQVPQWGKLLRRATLFATREEHGLHHSAPRNAHYSILSNKMGTLFDAVGVNVMVDNVIKRLGWGYDEGETMRHEVDARTVERTANPRE